MPTLIRVGDDVPPPSANVCWKIQTDMHRPHLLERCTLAKGHDTGDHPTPHTWDTPARLK